MIDELPFVHARLDGRIPSILVTSFDGPGGGQISEYLADRIQSRTGIPTLYTCKSVPVIWRGLSAKESDKNIADRARQLAHSRNVDMVIMGHALSDLEIELVTFHVEPYESSSLSKRLVSKSALSNPNQAFDDLAERVVYDGYKTSLRSIASWSRASWMPSAKGSDAAFDGLLQLFNFDFPPSARRLRRDLIIQMPLAIYASFEYAYNTKSCRVALVARDLSFTYLGKVHSLGLLRSNDEERVAQEASNLYAASSLQSYQNCTAEEYAKLRPSTMVNDGDRERRRDLGRVLWFEDELIEAHSQSDSASIRIAIPSFRYDSADMALPTTMPWAYPTDPDQETYRRIRVILASALYDILILNPSDHLGRSFRRGMIEALLLQSLSSLRRSPGYTLSSERLRNDCSAGNQLEETREWALLNSIGIDPTDQLRALVPVAASCRKRTR